jgi:hypothetical protein
MMIRWSRFNIYLVSALALGFVCGCHTEARKRNKVVSTFRVYLEAHPGVTNNTQKVSVFRDHPIQLTLEQNPVLTEAFVKETKIIEVVGGFALQIQLDRTGGLLLEQCTTANRGLHLAIQSQFENPSEEKLNSTRWLAAPRIQSRIADGLLTFTPDATREEAERIALGLNNVAKKLETGK